MLFALGLELPKKVFAHGWWTVEGQKMSKSKGNVVNPVEVVREVPVDALRYYLFSEMSFGSDGDYSNARLRLTLDSHLADNFGNLHRRLLTMADKYVGARLIRKGTLRLFSQTLEAIGEVDRAYFDLEFHRALEFTHKGFASLNMAIDREAPWRLAKEGKKDELEGFLFDTVATMALLAYVLSPVCPAACRKLLGSLGLQEEPQNFRDYLKEITAFEIRLIDPLFPKTK